MFDLPEFTWWQWSLISLTAIAVFIYRRQLMYQLLRFFAPRQIIGKMGMLPSKRDLIVMRDQLAIDLAETVSDEMIQRIVGALPLAMAEEAGQLKVQVAELNARLQTQRNAEFFLVGVHLRGLKMTDDDANTYYAPILLNPYTGKMKAPEDQKLRMIIATEDLEHVRSPFSKDSGRYGQPKVRRTLLGAPWYTRTSKDTHLVVLLGETYCVLVVQRPVERPATVA